MRIFDMTVALVLVCVVPPVSSAFAQGTKPSVFLGPQMRDGFADMDSGIRDSIRDIRQELQSAGFKLVQSDKEATLALVVLARGIVTQGSVGFASGSLGFGYVLPNTVPTLTTVLRVGQYERRMYSEGPIWRAAAKTVVEDLMAWWDANLTVFLSRLGTVSSLAQSLRRIRSIVAPC